MVFEAFNLSERYQTPAIIMLDKFLSESSMSCGNLSADKFTIDRGKISDPSKLKKVQKLSALSIGRRRNFRKKFAGNGQRSILC